MIRSQRKSLWTIMGVVSVSGIVALSLYAQQNQRPQGAPQGPPQGGGPQQMRMQFNPRDLVERTVFGSWGFISLDLDVTDDNLHKIHAIYREEWTKLKTALANVPDDQAKRQAAMQGAMEGVRSIREKTRPILNEEQNKKLDDWSQNQMRGFGGGAPGGGGGAGGNRGNRQQRQQPQQ